MTETLRFSKIYTEDFDRGTDVKEVRLQDGRTVLLHQVSSDTFPVPLVEAADLPATAENGHFRMQTDGHPGLQAYNTEWRRVGPNIFDVNADFGAHPDKSASYNDGALAEALAALPATGGALYLPGITADAYQFSTPLVIAAPHKLFGDGGAKSSGGTRRRTAIQYTGSGTAITITGATAAGARLEHFQLTHSGTADYGVEVTTAANHVVLNDLSIVSPAVDFAVAGVCVGRGGNLHSFTMEFCELRACAPVGLQIIDLTLFALIRKCAIHWHDTYNIELGTDAGTSADHVRIQNTAVEMNSGGIPIKIKRHIYVTIEGCHFETTADAGVGETYGIDITTDVGDYVAIQNNYLRTLGAGGGSGIDTLAVRVDCAAVTVRLDGNYVRSDNNGRGVLLNYDCRRAMVYDTYHTATNCQAVDTDDPDSSYRNVDVRNYIRAGENGPLEGTTPRMHKVLNPPVGNVGGGTDTLWSETIRAEELGRVGMGLKFEAYGNVVVGGNTKTMVVSFDGQTIVTKGPTTPGTAAWHVLCDIVKEDNNSAEINCQVWWDNAFTCTRQRFTVTGFDTPMVFLITGAATADNDIVIRAGWTTIMGC